MLSLVPFFAMGAVGDLPCSHVFLHRETFATLTPDQVMDSAALNTKAILASALRPMEDNICKGVYEATMKELEAAGSQVLFVQINFSRKRCERVLLKNGSILDHQPLTTAR